MKKVRVVSFLLLLAIFLCSCDSMFNEETIKIDGIDAFSIQQSDYELNVHILPSDSFLNQFDYINVSYHYRAHYKTRFSLIGTEKSLIVVEYQNSEYAQAKEYCLSQMLFAEENEVSYNGYTFLENVALPIGQDRVGRSFPEWFNMFAYNDSLNCLVFMGFYSPDYTSADAQSVSENWGTFLETHFSDIYDWDQKTGNDSVS